MEKQNILITGGAGAIGSNLSRRLCKKNSIVVVDDLSEGFEMNLRDILGNIDYLKGDILDPQILRELGKREFDYVFHLAAAFANEKSVQNPEYDASVNIMGSIGLLNLFKGTGIKRFVYAASSSSYGACEYAVEDMPPNPSTPYAFSKYAGEWYALEFNKLYGMKTTSVRYFNSYGPGERPGEYRNVVPNFFSLAMDGKPLPIKGTGEETRSFTYISDALEGTILAAAREEAIGEAFNIASGEETKVITLAEKINEICNNPAGVEYLEKRSWDEVGKRSASIEKAKKILGYAPRVNLDEGLKKTHEWFLENR